MYVLYVVLLSFVLLFRALVTLLCYLHSHARNTHEIDIHLHTVTTAAKGELSDAVGGRSTAHAAFVALKEQCRAARADAAALRRKLTRADEAKAAASAQLASAVNRAHDLEFELQCVKNGGGAGAGGGGGGNRDGGKLSRGHSRSRGSRDSGGSLMEKLVGGV
jgi:hypothetical protein